MAVNLCLFQGPNHIGCIVLRLQFIKLPGMVWYGMVC